MTTQDNHTEQRYTFSNITQGKYRFYSLTMPSDVLAKVCYVTTREEDPQKGFQRVLDKKRAQEIAEYIDSGLGTIPNSIVLSAQPEANLRVIKNGKILAFDAKPKSFLVLDGQHRVFGFVLAKSQLRVPVIIYNGLTRQEESRLFIDINTKQRPVPNELLLDIKKLADYETDIEKQLGELFDLFDQSSDSPLLGLLSSSSKTKNKISRVTFNAALKPLISTFQDRDIEEIYEAICSYIRAFISGMSILGIDNKLITKPTNFRACIMLFREAGQRVKDKYGANYSVENFYDILKPMFDNAHKSWFQNSRSVSALHEKMRKELNTFTL
ncbi:DndB-like protein [Geitlerinema sp. FC II]|nr:DndB-like protein [Geitlerinema sp. FC II]